MRRLRNRLLIGVCAGALLAVAISPPARADLPVIDVANLGEWAVSIADDAKSYAVQIEQWATEVKTYIGDEFSWVTQASQYATQLSQYANEIQMFINWVHNPTLGGALGLLNYAGLGTLFPINPMSLLGVINGLESIGNGGSFTFGSLAGILGSFGAFGSQVFAKNHVYSPTDGSWDSEQLNAGGVAIAGAQGAAAAAFSKYQDHSNAMPDLRSHLLGLTSPKDVADTQAQIALEQLWTENQTGQLLTAQLMADQQVQSRQQRDEEAVAMSFDNWLSASGTGLR